MTMIKKKKTRFEYKGGGGPAFLNREREKNDSACGNFFSTRLLESDMRAARSLFFVVDALK